MHAIAKRTINRLGERGPWDHAEAMRTIRDENMAAGEGNYRHLVTYRRDRLADGSTLETAFYVKEMVEKKRSA